MMGLDIHKVVFDGYAPELARIAEKVEAQSGLAVNVAKSREFPELQHEVHGELAFAALPKAAVEVHAYGPGNVRNWLDREDGSALLPQMHGVVQGCAENPGKQTIYVHVCSTVEPTLAMFILRALQALGGVPERPMGEHQSALCESTLTEADLVERKWQHARKLFPLQLLAGFGASLSATADLFGAENLSRKKLNDALAQDSAAVPEADKLPPIGRVAYARGVVASFPFMLIGLAISALSFIAIIFWAPFYLAYVSAKYALFRFGTHQMG